MKFTTEDLAYTCDLYALNKKINALADNSHSNDAIITYIQDTYTTVDEVNEALSNYSLKTDINEVCTADQVVLGDDGYLNRETLKEASDNIVMSSAATKKLVGSVHSYAYTKCIPKAIFSSYMKSAEEKYLTKDDLTYNAFIDLPIEHKTPPVGLYDFKNETAFVEFHEGAILEGYAMIHNAATNEYIHRDFTITIHTDGTDGDRHLYYYIFIR